MAEINGTNGTTTNTCEKEQETVIRTRSFTEILGHDLNINPNPESFEDAHIKSMQEYNDMYRQSIEDPESFWTKYANELYWKEKWPGKFMDYNFDVRKGDIFVKFMEGGKTNVCYNVLDKIAAEAPDKVAFYWEGNEVGNQKKFTYKQILDEVCKFANVLKSQGLKKGDRVALYMPMIIELVIAMLACTRLGIIHSIVFAGFSADSLADRILEGKCSTLITSDFSVRGKKIINLKTVADDALQICVDSGLTFKSCIVVKNNSVDGDGTHSPKQKKANSILWNEGIDVWWHDLMINASPECECEWMDAEDPLFILYTSGSTGKPKGVLHTTGGYLLYAKTTFKLTFDYHDGEVYWCTADIGWITGHSYIVYGPMANGATSVMFEGIPLYPDAGRMWAICEKYKVSSFYTAPTAIRMLMKFSDEFVKKHNVSSLRILGTVGEPINPEAWLWYYKVVGDSRCSIVDTFWQTETGGHVITGLPSTTMMKPGSASFPFFGVEPAILDDDGNEILGNDTKQGFLVLKRPCPGLMRTLYGNHPRYQSTYFEKFPGYYCAGDGAYRDKDGYYWITGRIDDLMNVSGHLLSTAEVESALVEHSSISEAAVVGYSHDVKGNGIYCFVTPKNGIQFCDALVYELKQKVRARVGPIATPDFIHNAPGLPKTRSGKIMRRILRKIAAGESDIGNTTTLADPTVIEKLIANRTR